MDRRLGRLVLDSFSGLGTTMAGMSGVDVGAAKDKALTVTVPDRVPEGWLLLSEPWWL